MDNAARSRSPLLVRPALRPGRAEPFVRLQGLTRTYQVGPAHVAALGDVSFDVPRGAFTVVVGKSGSGKSTLLHLLAAMESPSAGELHVGPWQLSALDRRAQARYRREMVGMIFQQFNLIPSMTAEDNVALPLMLAGVATAERHRRARASLDVVGLSPRRAHRPTELSGGEQQRVAIARALVTDPPLLLADEPTGNLDSDTGARIVDLLGRVQREQHRTVVMVTHDPEDVAHLADRTLTLHDGRLA